MNKIMLSQSLQSPFSAAVASQAAVLERPLPDDVAFDEKGGQHFVVIPIADVDELSMNAVRYAKVLSGKIVAVHILLNPSDRDRMESGWEIQNMDVPLIILRSPNGSLIGPLTTFVDSLRSNNKENILTIVLPVLTGLKWWQRVLHNQTASLIEKAFQSKEGMVITRVPFSLTEASYKGGCVL